MACTRDSFTLRAQGQVSVLLYIAPPPPQCTPCEYSHGHVEQLNQSCISVLQIVVGDVNRQINVKEQQQSCLIQL
jgi:hypothetical protein